MDWLNRLETIAAELRKDRGLIQASYLGGAEWTISVE